jgi:hypothetical protein
MHSGQFGKPAQQAGLRPSTAYEFAGEGLDFDSDLVDLNPPGRVQTPKYRPIVKMPPSLKAHLRTINDREGLLIHKGNGQPIKRWETAWRKMRIRAGRYGRNADGSFRPCFRITSHTPASAAN